MKTDLLRKYLLQLAVQGKLVPQQTSEGTAQDLVDNIREEKAVLVSEKKLKKDPKESYIYRDEEGHFVERIGKQEPVCIDNDLPFAVPEGWTWARLGEINTYESRLINPNLFPDDIYELYSVPTYNTGEPEYVKGKSVGSSKQSVQKNDVLISKINPHINRVWKVFKKSSYINVASSEWIVFRNSRVDSDYLRLYFSAPYFRTMLQSQVSGVGGSLMRAKPEEVKKYFLPLPPLAEQARIVKKVEELQKELEEMDASRTDMKKRCDLTRKMILQQAIKGALVPQQTSEGTAQDLVDNIREEKAVLVSEKKLKKDPNESYIYRDEEGHFMERIGKQEPVCIDKNLPFAVPVGWTWARLGEMINLLSGRDLAPSEYFSIKSGIPYITGASNFKNGEIEINRWSNNPVTISHAGDLLITCKGTIGEMAYNNIGDVHIARQIMAISTEYINISYIEIILKSQLHNLEKKAKSMIPGISRDVLIDFLLPLPPLAEQARIVSKVEELLEELDEMEKAVG